MMIRLCFLFLCFCATWTAHGQSRQEGKAEQSTSLRSLEKKLSVKQGLNTTKLDYNLEPIEQGHFKLVFVTQPEGGVNIKIYDIIGNLILSESTDYSLDNELEYNFNEKNNKIYVVKVESGKDNLTKKVNF